MTIFYIGIYNVRMFLKEMHLNKFESQIKNIRGDIIEIHKIRSSEKKPEESKIKNLYKIRIERGKQNWLSH